MRSSEPHEGHEVGAVVEVTIPILVAPPGQSVPGVCRKVGQTWRMAYIVGSTGRRWLESQSAVAGNEDPPEGEWVPHGTCHAVPEGSVVALCGAGDLCLLDDNPWGRGMLDRCFECSELGARD